MAGDVGVRIGDKLQQHRTHPLLECCAVCIMESTGCQGTGPRAETAGTPRPSGSGPRATAPEPSTHSQIVR